MACQPVKTISSKTGSALLVLDWYRSHSMCPPLHQATLECHHPAYTRRGRYILLFVGPCVLNLFAAVAVAGIARLRGFNWFRSTWRDPAVQAIGASWVVASVAAVFYILLGLLCILASYTSYGVGDFFPPPPFHRIIITHKERSSEQCKHVWVCFEAASNVAQKAP